MALGCRFIHFLIPLPPPHSHTEAHTKEEAQSVPSKYGLKSAQEKEKCCFKINEKTNITTSQLTSNLSNEIGLIPILTLLTVTLYFKYSPNFSSVYTFGANGIIQLHTVS